MIVKESIGNGNFGTVFKGLWMDDQKERNVALKEFKDNSMDSELFQEASILSQLHHKNIIRFWGIAKSQGTLLMVMELAKYGSLRDYLMKHPEKFPVETISSVATQVANGLAYLHSHNIVHRDLGLRNILLIKMEEQVTVKIADFGLSKMLLQSKVYVKFEGAIPVR